MSFLLHLQLVIHVIGTGLHDGGPVFLALCMLPPLVGEFTPSGIWTKGVVADMNLHFFF